MTAADLGSEGKEARAGSRRVRSELVAHSVAKELDAKVNKKSTLRSSTEVAQCVGLLRKRRARCRERESQRVKVKRKKINLLFPHITTASSRYSDNYNNNKSNYI